MKREELYSKFFDAFVKVFTTVNEPGGSGGRWPMPRVRDSIELTVFTEPLVARAFLRCTDELLRRGKTVDDLGQFLHYPSIVARLGFLFRTRVLWAQSKNEQLEFGYRVVEILATMYADRPFVEEGMNHIIAQEDVMNSLASVKLGTITDSNRQMVNYVNGMLWTYTEVLAPRWHNLHHEFQGPYFLGDGRILLVKEWHDLRPEYHAFSSRFPFSWIVEYEILKPTTTIKLDIHNRLFSNPNVREAIECWGVICDGKQIELQALHQMIQEAMPPLLEHGSQFLAALDLKAMVVFNGQMEFAAIRPLAEVLGEAWFTQEAIEESFVQGFTPKRQTLLEQYHALPKTPENWRKIYDVREQFPD